MVISALFPFLTSSFENLSAEHVKYQYNMCLQIKFYLEIDPILENALLNYFLCHFFWNQQI